MSMNWLFKRNYLFFSHRLEFFEAIDFKSLLPNNWSKEEESDLWKTDK